MRSSRTTRSRFLGAWVLSLSLVALLLWGKLRLVTGVPRTAYADPARATARVQPGKPGTVKRAPVPQNRPDLAGD